MKRFLNPGHLIGLAVFLGLVYGIFEYWPWPFFVLRTYAPGFFKMYLLPFVRDYQMMIAWLAPILILSLANVLWLRVAGGIEKFRSGK